MGDGQARGVSDRPRIARWLEAAAWPGAAAALREIFYEASGTKHFASDEVRAAFEDRWLGRYLVHDAGHVLVAVAPDGTIAGYLAGSLDDPARAKRFADVGYFTGLADVTRRFPAHLHINFDPRFRNRGWGRVLIEAFVDDVRAAGLPGVHVVTGRGLRNVRFYRANGFEERASLTWNGRDLVLLGRDLSGGAIASPHRSGHSRGP